MARLLVVYNLVILVLVCIANANAWISTSRLRQNGRFHFVVPAKTSSWARLSAARLNHDDATDDASLYRPDRTACGGGQSRRQWIQRATGMVVAPLVLPHAAAWAEDSATTETVVTTLPSTRTRAPRDLISSAAVCDPTVSVWKEPNRDRLVYVLGTAHISKLSADLSRQLVRDVNPDAVFVELDLKRVGGLARYVQQERDLEQSVTSLTITAGGGGTDTTTRESSSAAPAATPTTVVVPVVSRTSSAAEDGSLVPVPMESRGGGGGFWNGIRQRALNFGAAAVGNAVRGMYQNLGDAGFNPGEEFAAAITEGQKVGAAVILGDQDVEYTLRRLTQALAVTDLNKLNDEALQDKFKDLMGGSDVKDLPLPGGNMDDLYKQELTSFVEKLKSRDSVRRIMGQLKEVAPALVQVMLSERDAYMATGIDTVNQFECIVAVMGIAHMDGVERNLVQKGWKQVYPQC